MSRKNKPQVEEQPGILMRSRSLLDRTYQSLTHIVAPPSSRGAKRKAIRAPTTTDTQRANRILRGAMVDSADELQRGFIEAMARAGGY
jgi:hypothetical protein